MTRSFSVIMASVYRINNAYVATKTLIALIAQMRKIVIASITSSNVNILASAYPWRSYVMVKKTAAMGLTKEYAVSRISQSKIRFLTSRVLASGLTQ